MTLPSKHTSFRSCSSSPTLGLHEIVVKGRSVVRSSSTSRHRHQGSTLCKSGGGFIGRCPSLPSLSRVNDRTTQRHLRIEGISDPLKEGNHAAAEHYLKPNASVRIGNRLFQILAKLGHGSFGSVWAAHSKGADEAAVKEIRCRSPNSLANTLYEANVLTTLSVDAAKSVSQLFPALLGRDVVSIGTERWRVRLAMTRIPGVSLAAFLKAQNQPLWYRDPKDFCVRIAEASRLSRELLSQLSSAFEHISMTVLHRDVNPQNIMIDDRGTSPRFGIVDFGLATDAFKWRADTLSSTVGKGSNLAPLRRCGAVGHGCFWPAASWLVFIHGSEKLTHHPDLCYEFAECLDFHGLGMVAMKIIAEALHPLSSGVNGLQTLVGSDFESRLYSLHKSWEAYWRVVSVCWQRLAKLSGAPADLAALKISLARCNFQKTVGRDLTNLKRAVKDVSVACHTLPAGLGLSELPKVLDEIAIMISGSERPHKRPDWKGIRRRFCEPSVVVESKFYSESLSPVCGRSSTSRSTGTPPSSEHAQSSCAESHGETDAGEICGSPTPVAV